ncbi:MAG: O-methyltransferase [Chloroflexi bacterium]|nr:O-methyltransferase [Chloroflexota bacterium]
MSVDIGETIDAYVTALSAPQDEALTAALDSTKAAGMPPIQVPPTLGKLLSILVKLAGGTKVLELGTLGGYSGIWIARALKPGGKLISLDINPHHAEVARQSFARAGLSDRVEVRVGPALEQLPGLRAEAPFDLIYIDADKENYVNYLNWALELTHSGSLIVADNVLRGGAVIAPKDGDEGAKAVHDLNEQASTDPRLSSVIIPNRNGRDGYLIAYVN